MCALKIPLVNSTACIHFFPDELPEDYFDIVDVLRSEMAPLRAWRLCAVSLLLFSIVSIGELFFIFCLFFLGGILSSR
jgi:hypothetical protein